MDSWDLLVDRGDLGRTGIVAMPRPELEPGQALLRISTVGITANNVTYGVLGDALRYWAHFPADLPWGRIPAWGFADVEASTTDGLAVGERVYGYLPTSSHLVVTPDRLSPQGFRDASPHRADLPGAYLAYDRVDADTSHTRAVEPVEVLYRPLLLTAFVLDDWLGAEVLTDVDQVVVASASSRTAYATALQTAAGPDHPELIGLTSARNAAFVEGLSCYDRVLAYDAVAEIPAPRSTAVIDMAGDPDLRRRLHDHLGDALVRDVMVGATHKSMARPADLPGVAPELFFAPDQIRRRTQEWGREGLATRVAAAWETLLPVVADRVRIVDHDGPEGLAAAWTRALEGTVPPDEGLVAHL